MATFTLPALPYAFDALEPHIDAKTMEIHHDKHHAAYVNNLNDALKDHADLQAKSIEELLKGLGQVPEAIRTKVRNNGGGHYNHTLFWDLMQPGGAKAPTGELLEAINGSFGSVAEMAKQVNTSGATRFGSGWAWVVLDDKKNLAILSTANQDSPITDGLSPILTIDVWEHAYYLKYQNRRPDYLTAWWNVVNWDEVAKRFAAAK
jgi:Fe-Mn family superoxide dismutase